MLLFAKVFAQSSGGGGNAPASQVINNAFMGVRRVNRQRIAGRNGTSFTSSNGQTAQITVPGVRRTPRRQPRQQITGVRRTTSRRG
jgi:hypothetical protein